MKLRLAAMAATVLLLAACSKVNADNYAKLETGMSRDAVVALIGEPDHCDSALGFESCRWGDDSKHIEARFAAGALLSKSGKGL